MPFSSFDQILTAAFSNLYDLEGSKTIASTTVANVPHTLWTATGYPQAGTYGTAGAGNGRTLTASTAGALPYINAGGGTTNYLVSVGATNNLNAACSLILVDRISDVQLSSAAVGTTSITGLDATSRLASGEGAMLWIEVSSAQGTGTNTYTFTYTNQAGTSGRTTAITGTASAIVGRSVNTYTFQTLAAGDIGIRSIQSYSITTGQTGNICVCLVRPLAVIPISTPNAWSGRDMIIETPWLPKLYDSSCLAWILIPSAASTNFQIYSEIRICAN